MSQQTLELLETFEALPEEEKRNFTSEFLRRVIPFDSGPLDDEDITRIAGATFVMLDNEERDEAAPW